MGFFSWMTQDTNRSIANHYSPEPVFTVYMMDDKGNSWREDNYEGYGEFDGKDYYELLDEMNGGSGERDRGIELDLGLPTIRNVHTGEVLDKTWGNWADEIIRDNMSANELMDTGDWEHYDVKPPEVRYPNLVENPDWTWRNDQPENCEFQGFFYNAESDDKSFAAAQGSHEEGWKLVGKYRRMCRAAPRGTDRWENVSARMAAGFTLSEIRKLQQFIRKKADEVGGYAGDGWWDSITSVIVDGGATKFGRLKRVWDEVDDEDDAFEPGENWMENQTSIDYEENYLYPMHPFDMDDQELHDNVLKSMKLQKLGSIKDPKIRKAWGVSDSKNAEGESMSEAYSLPEPGHDIPPFDCDCSVDHKWWKTYADLTPEHFCEHGWWGDHYDCDCMWCDNPGCKIHDDFIKCVGCGADICDECHSAYNRGDEAFESNVGWMCCPECYDENVDVEYTVRKDAECGGGTEGCVGKICAQPGCNSCLECFTGKWDTGTDECFACYHLDCLLCGEDKNWTSLCPAGILKGVCNTCFDQMSGDPDTVLWKQLGKTHPYPGSTLNWIGEEHYFSPWCEDCLHPMDTDNCPNCGNAGVCSKCCQCSTMDAEIRTFDAPKATNRTTGKTWIQMRNMNEMALINLMDRTHPSWGVKKGLMKATTKRKFADAMAKSATEWVDASVIKETVDQYLWEDPLKSGPNKGKVKIWNQGKYVYVPHTKAAITKVFKQILVAENKWCKDKAKLKGLNTYAWKTWGPYFHRFHRGGGSSDIFTAMGITGWDKHTFIDLTRAMMAMDLVEQGKTEEDAWGFDKSPAKAKATMKAYGMTPPANIGKAPPKPKAKAKSSGSKTSKRKGMARRKAKPKSRSSDVKKRKGPNTSATSFNLGTRKKGNDGKMWTVKRSGNSKRWVRGAEEVEDGRAVVQWEDAQGLSSPSGQPSNIKWAETEWVDDDVDLSLSHPIKDGAYVAIGLGIGTLVLAAGLTAVEILLTRLRD